MDLLWKFVAIYALGAFCSACLISWQNRHSSNDDLQVPALAAGAIWFIWLIPYLICVVYEFVKRGLGRS